MLIRVLQTSSKIKAFADEYGMQKTTIPLDAMIVIRKEFDEEQLASKVIMNLRLIGIPDEVVEVFFNFSFSFELEIKE